MNIIVLYLGNTISGFPGSSFTFFLYLKPFENKYFLTKISGLVSLPEILDIISERLYFENISDINYILQNQPLLAQDDQMHD